MKLPPLLLRRLAIGAVILLLLGALAFVALRTGPLAPVKVTLTQVHEGRLSPAIFGIGTVEARRNLHKRGRDRLRKRCRDYACY